MATGFKWLFRLGAGLLILILFLAALAAGLAYYLVARSLPDYDRVVSGQAVSAPVEIVRSTGAVPHIFGESDADVLYGLGYVHAQDRLWQMSMMRRTVQGRLSELFGAQTLGIDQILRRFDLYILASSSLDSQSPRTRRLLEAYANGVNARISEVNRRAALGRGAPERLLFNAPIEPWQPADSLAIQKLMSLQLTSGVQEEVLRARVSLALDDEDRLNDILPDYPGQGLVVLPDYAALVPGIEGAVQQTASLPQHPLSPIPERGFGGASNAWAAATTRSASGGTLLANDPHLELTAPSIWYLARLELSSGGVIGGTIPGIPAVITGRSAQLGWALTLAYMDDQDILIEALNPQNPDQYLGPQGYQDFVTRESVIRVRDQDPVTITLRWTDNGPVLPPETYNLASVTPEGHVAAISWTALSPVDTSMNSAIGLMFAANVGEAIAAGEDLLSPAQNLTLVDRETIAMKIIGAQPRRVANHESRGRLPSLGARAENRWQGRLPYASNPEFLAPRSGLLGNSNNKTVSRPFPLHITYSWGDSQRVQRMQTLLQARRLHTLDSFVEAQLDIVSVTAQTLLPLVIAALEEGADEAEAQQREAAVALLAGWDGAMDAQRPEPLIYAAWMRALQERLAADELGPLMGEFKSLEPLFIERVYRDTDEASRWCDRVDTAAQEDCADMARLALDDALAWLAEHQGDNLAALRWGDAHPTVQDHRVLGEIAILKHFVNIRHPGSGGDQTLQRGQTSGEAATPFHSVNAAGYRGVYDFADPDSSRFIISTGQSGHFLSRHYDDLAQIWQRGDYIPMSLDEAQVRAEAIGVTQLLP
jgi:penicillin amidase